MLVPHNSTVLLVDSAGLRLFRNGGREMHPRLEQLACAVFDHEEGGAREKREAAAARAALTALREKAAEQGPLILIAAPRMLGTLRAHMSIRERGRVVAEVRKELAASSADELAQRLHDLRQ
jgi:protein required for attachment to host cells